MASVPFTKVQIIQTKLIENKRNAKHKILIIFLKNSNKYILIFKNCSVNFKLENTVFKIINRHLKRKHTFSFRPRLETEFMNKNVDIYEKRTCD